MLTTIMKYELKSSSRLLLPLFGLITALAVFFRLMGFAFSSLWPTSEPIVDLLLVLVYYLGAFAISVATFIIILMNFYNSMLGKQGYLTFTLPVKLSSIINGKLFVAMIWSFASYLITLLINQILLFDRDMANIFIHRISYSGIPANSLVAISIWILVLSTITVYKSLVQIYASMAIGSQFGKNRILASIVSYFITNTIEGIATIFLILVPIVILANTKLEWLDTIFSEMSFADANFMLFVNIFFFVIAIFALIFGVIYHVVTYRIFSNKLNLE